MSDYTNMGYLKDKFCGNFNQVNLEKSVQLKRESYNYVDLKGQYQLNVTFYWMYLPCWPSYLVTFKVTLFLNPYGP